MMNVTDLVDRYVAVWNEPNADERRKRIRSLWAPDGTTCYRLLDSHGYDAIEARVASSWDKWLRTGQYIFRPRRDAVCHHDVVKVNWEMVALASGETEAVGLSFLVLNSQGQIQSDYQFNPLVSEANGFVDRYLAVWNEPDGPARRGLIAELWAPDCTYFCRTSVYNGHSAIEAEAINAYHAYVARGFVFSSANSAQAHHNLVRLKWHMQSRDCGEVATAGSDLLILDEGGRIRLDYRYEEPAWN